MNKEKEDKKMWEYLTSNYNIWKKVNETEELFLMRLENDFINDKKLSYYKSRKLNQIYNKYISEE